MNTETIPSLKKGQWIKAWDGSVGYVEEVDGETGPYRIRLLSQWDWSGPLPIRSGGGFEPLKMPERFSEQARQIADELWHLLSSKR